MALKERASSINLESLELDEALETIIGRMEGAEDEIVRSVERKSKDLERESSCREC